MTIQEMRERKIELGYTNEKLAELTKVPYSTIQKIFAGKTSAPRRSTILALEEALQPEKALHPEKTLQLEKILQLEKTLQKEENAGHARKDTDPAASTVPTATGAAAVPAAARAATVPTATMPTVTEAAAVPAAAGAAAVPAETETAATVPARTGGSANPGTVYSTRSGLPDGIVMEQAPAYGTAKAVRKYTIYDYFSFPDDRQRCEVIDGIIYDMASPTLHHQWILTQLGREFSNFIDEHNGDCRAFVAPLDVTPDPADIYTIVQPDVMIICDRSLLEGKYCKGAPDLVVEILSPSTRRKDLTIKTAKYASAGVREYWIVDIDAERVLVYDFAHGDSIGIYGFDTEVPVAIWDGQCKVNFRRIMDRL